MKREYLIVGLVVILLIYTIYHFGFHGKSIEEHSHQVTHEMSSDGTMPGYTPDKSFIMENPNRQVRTLMALSNYNGLGQAYVTHEGEKLGVYIMADLSNQADKVTYQAWLTDASHKKSLLLGTMSANMHGSYEVTRVLEGNNNTYTKIIVSAEKTDDNTPEDILLEGNI